MDDTEAREHPLWRGYDGRLLIAISLGWFAVRLGREAIPPLLPAIIDAIEITPADAGFGLTVMWLVYSLAQYPGGRLSDGLSRKTVLVASLGTLVVGFLVLGVVTAYAGLLAGFSLVGIGAGLYFAPSRAVLADLYTSRRGRAFGIMSAAGSIGASAAAGVAIVALTVGRWQSAFLPVLAVFVAVLVALHRWQRGGYVLAPVSLDVRPTASRLVRIPQIRWILVAYTLVSFSWQGFLGFLPTLLQVEKGFSPVLAGTTYALVFVVAIVIGPVSGWLGDVVSRVVVAIVGVAIAVLGIVSLLASAQPLVIGLGVVLFAVGLRAYPPVMQAHLMGLFPDESMAGDFGGIKTVWTGFGSLSPTYVGVVAASSSYHAAFGGFIACLLATVVLLSVVLAAGDG